MNNESDTAEQQALHIMILDDEPIVCKRLKPIFEKRGHSVETFTDSDRALARLRETSFDVVITDLKMEGADGIQVLAEAKASSAQTQVIIITGFATSETARESYDKGAVEFIAKPFKIGDIVASIERIEEQRRTGQASGSTRRR